MRVLNIWTERLFILTLAHRTILYTYTASKSTQLLLYTYYARDPTQYQTRSVREQTSRTHTSTGVRQQRRPKPRANEPYIHNTYRSQQTACCFPVTLWNAHPTSHSTYIHYVIVTDRSRFLKCTITSSYHVPHKKPVKVNTHAERMREALSGTQECVNKITCASCWLLIEQQFLQSPFGVENVCTCWCLVSDQKP